MNSTEIIYTTVPLGNAAHAQARQFAAEQLTPLQGKQIYLNTLAVYAVHQYLKWLQINTDLAQAESWHPGQRVLLDVADLPVSGIGKLECRPVMAGETTIALPPETTQDRIGYVGVQFNEHLNEAKLLGFIKAADVPVNSESIAIAELQSIDALLDYLPEAMTESASSTSRPRVNLSQWLQSTFETSWQSLEALLGSDHQLAFSLRSRLQPTETTVQRAKLIDLGLQLGHQPVILLVAIAPIGQENVAESEVEILVQVHPIPEVPHLPSNLQLNLLSETGEVLQGVRSRDHDNYIQLKCFEGTPGECFDIQLILGTNSLTETFVI